jgi:hypothetical protein
MRSIRVIAPVAFVAAAAAGVSLFASTPSVTSAAAESGPAIARGPLATASGGDVATLVYPSIVNVRLVRAEAGLTQAATLVDQNKGAAAVPVLKAVQSNMTAAWAAAKYVIQTAPPPVATDDAVGHASGGAVAGASPYAAPEQTGLAVLNLQHDVIGSSLGLLDAAPAALQTQIKTTVNATLKARKNAVAYIHTIAPPPVAADDAFAHASGGAVLSDWATLMPTYLPFLDDEIQQVKGTRAINPKLTPTFLKNVRVTARATENTINKYWPPVPADD